MDEAAEQRDGDRGYQNSHSWASAQPPANSAMPVLRAGLTEAL